jgi:hypothetical protein
VEEQHARNRNTPQTVERWLVGDQPTRMCALRGRTLRIAPGDDGGRRSGPFDHGLPYGRPSNQFPSTRADTLAQTPEIGRKPSKGDRSSRRV